MNRLILAAAAVVLVGGGAAWWFSQGTEAPSTGVTAPPVETTTTVVTESTEAPATTRSDQPPTVVYSLTDQSTASFTIEEELRGAPTTVVGTSGIVLGEIAYSPPDPASLQIGTVLVNARDFQTDSSNRNRAIRGPILDSEEFEFIEFAPASIVGFDGTGAPFSVSGDLTIRGIAHPVTFDVTASLDGEAVTGTATATVDRTLWGLDIPSAPGVANVSEMVTLTLTFVAAPTS